MFSRQFKLGYDVIHNNNVNNVNGKRHYYRTIPEDLSVGVRGGVFRHSSHALSRGTLAEEGCLGVKGGCPIPKDPSHLKERSLC